MLTFGRGRPRPLFAGAAPKIILSMLLSQWLRKMYEKNIDAIGTAGMGETWVAFRGQIAAIRRQGFYISRGELEPALAAVAAPIPATTALDPSAVALVTTIERFEELGGDVLTQQVLKMAQNIDAALRQQAER